MKLSNECFLKSNCNKYKKKNCPEAAFCLKLFKIEKLFENSLLPEIKWESFSLRIDKDGTDKKEFSELAKISTDIQSFVKNGKNLYIYSSIPGNGKSSWAIRLIQSYINQIWADVDVELNPCKALFISLPKYFIELKNNISRPSKYIEHIDKYVDQCDLVVWDDIATKAGTEFEMSHFLSILDYRLSSGKSNIYTSNTAPAFLSEFVGERLYSRIINESKVIGFNGKDKRGI